MKYPYKLHAGKLRAGLFSVAKPVLSLFAVSIMASVAVPVGTAAAMPASTNTTPDAVTATRLSEQQAISAVFNRVETQKDVRGERIVVNNPHHRVSFAPDGVHFSPRQGPDWHWQLAAPSKTTHQSALPRQGAVDYIRPGYIERYLLKANTIEQRFILEQPYTAKQDLVIDGRINSAGQFSTTDTGWRWQDENGAVNLGQVTVFDANGKILPASMHTTAEHSRITVAANVLHTAAYPVTIDPEIGGDIRLSDMGDDGNTDFDAFTPAVAYNSTNNEYLVVWFGDDNTGALVNGESEIFGQQVNAATGAEIGDNDFRLSDMGDDSNTSFSASDPAVAYSTANNEYLPVWHGDDNSGALVDSEIEIFAQRFAGPALLRFTHTVVSAAENIGSTQIEVQRVGDPSTVVTVDFNTSDGTATTPGDYTTASGTLTFGSGETSQSFAVAIIDNSDINDDKTLNLSLSNPQGGGSEVTLDAGASAAVLTIEDDDATRVDDGDDGSSGSGGNGSLNPILLMLLFSTWLASRWISQQRRVKTSLL